MIGGKFEDLNQKEIELICNGCGNKGGIIKVPDFMFTASCNKHDYSYWLGGTESDREKADKGFYKAMVKDAGNSRFYRFWAWVYYIAVRTFGGLFFNYTD